MNAPTKFRYIKFFIALSLGSLYASFQVLTHGPITGLYLALLSWSFFILCIPAAHGSIIFGVPIRLFRHKPFFTQPFVWVFAFILNAITITFSPIVYTLTLPAHLLLRMIENPYPCWLVFVISAIGTLYPILIGNERFYSNRSFNLLIHHIIKLVGLLTFVYCAHPELVIILNTIS